MFRRSNVSRARERAQQLQHKIAEEFVQLAEMSQNPQKATEIFYLSLMEKERNEQF